MKPSNIVIETGTNRPVLIDFGLARRRSASNPRLSITAGTPLYMAPEQATDPNGTKTTFKADIYALACTAFELFTGRPVFDGTSVYEILTGHLTSPPPPLSRHRPDLAALDAAFARALAKDPGERDDSATAFVEALAAALQHSERTRRNDTAPPASSVHSDTSGAPAERVLILARDDSLIRQLRKVTTRAVAGAARVAVIEQVASASELVAAFEGSPAAIVLVDEDSAEIGSHDLVRRIQELSGGRGASILVVSREWQSLRPRLGHLGVRDVLPKPLVVQMLSQAIERIVARRSNPADI